MNGNDVHRSYYEHSTKNLKPQIQKNVKQCDLRTKNFILQMSLATILPQKVLMTNDSDAYIHIYNGLVML